MLSIYCESGTVTLPEKNVHTVLAAVEDTRATTSENSFGSMVQDVNETIGIILDELIEDNDSVEIFDESEIIPAIEACGTTLLNPGGGSGQCGVGILCFADPFDGILKEEKAHVAGGARSNWGAETGIPGIG